MTTIISLANTRNENAKAKLRKFAAEFVDSPFYMLSNCDDQFKAAAIVEAFRILSRIDTSLQSSKIDESIAILIGKINLKSTSTTSNLMDEKLLAEYLWWKEQLLTESTK